MIVAEFRIDVMKRQNAEADYVMAAFSGAF